MDLSHKLRILADSAKYDASCASSGVTRGGAPGALGNSDGTGICHSYTPDGRCVSLLKILLTNFCIFDCQYCVNRVSSDVERARFSVREVVDLTIEFYKRNYVEGLFLSSGVIQSADYTTEQLVDVARRLRVDHQFRGYIHLKIIPGTSRQLVLAAGRYADRVSANIELPTERDLARLAPEKSRTGIEQTMAEVSEELQERRPDFAPAGQTTQMIVGATTSSDADILCTASELYERHRLRRVYYSAFSPIPRSPRTLPSRPPELAREHRLYEADWLLRHYGFAARELTTDEQPNLDPAMSPKLAWALRNRHAFPIDINSAAREVLLRIPGVGYRTVDRLIKIRRHHRLAIADLVKLRVRLSEARPFIITADSKPSLSLLDSPTLRDRFVQPVQLPLLVVA
jgi:putative DNA modification/repair radical SAM protein